MFDYLRRDLNRCGTTFDERVREVLLNPGTWAVLGYRLRRWIYAARAPQPIRSVLVAISTLIQTWVLIATNIDLPVSAEIGPGLYIPHTGFLVVSSGARIGCNCTLAQGVTVGHRRGGLRHGNAEPMIGDRVYVGPSALVLGSVTVGNDAVVGAGAVVIHSVPPGGVAVGNPARVISTRGSFDLIHYAGMEQDRERIAAEAALRPPDDAKRSGSFSAAQTVEAERLSGTSASVSRSPAKACPQDRILLISCYFPPAGGIGVQRALSLARYLPQNGFKVFVLTARCSVPTVDPELMQLIPQEVEVHRTWTLEPPFQLRKKLWSRLNSNSSPTLASKAKSKIVARVKRLISPDPQSLWYPFAVRRGARLIRREGIQTILVTAPPFSAFLIAHELKRKFRHLSVLADVRDEREYFMREFVFRGDTLAADRAAEIEAEMVRSCDRMISVTRASCERTRSRYPQQPDEKFTMIPNGYDPAAFANFTPRPNQSGKLLLTYAGTIYQPSSPKGYLDALDGLPEVCCQIVTRFVGRIAEEFDRSIFDGRRSVMERIEFVPQKQALHCMEEADVLLLPWSDRLNIPGKAFEYVATGKPILALCHRQSELWRLIGETSSGWSVDLENIRAIQETLQQICELRGKYPHPRNWEAIRRYERPRLAAEYARLIRAARKPSETQPMDCGLWEREAQEAERLVPTHGA